MANTARKNWRHILGLGLMLGAFGIAMAQMPQGGLSAQALQGAAGGLTSGAGAGGLGTLGLAASSAIRSADPLPNAQGLNGLLVSRNLRIDRINDHSV